MLRLPSNLIQNQLDHIIHDCQSLHILNAHQSLLILKKYQINIKPLTDKFNTNSLFKLFRSSQLEFSNQDVVSKISNTFDRIPYFIIVRGNVDIIYKNFEGVEFVESMKRKEFVSLNKEKMINLHGENSLVLLKDFKIRAHQGSLFLRFPIEVVDEIQQEKSEIIIRLIIREKQILKYYGLELNQFKLQTINQSIQFQYQNRKFLLLRGLICICKDNILLAAYKEGMYDTNINFKFHTRLLIFSGSELIFMDNDNETSVKGSVKHANLRRESHIQKLLLMYKNLSQYQIKKIQSIFIEKNQINQTELSKFLTTKSLQNSKLNLRNLQQYRSVSTLQNINKKSSLKKQKMQYSNLVNIKKQQKVSSPIKFPKIHDKGAKSLNHQFGLKKIQKFQY